MENNLKRIDFVRLRINSNEKKRLELIYNGKANFEIANQNDFVVTKLSIPTNF